MKQPFALLLLLFSTTATAQTTPRLQNEQPRSVQDIWAVSVQQLNASEQEVYVLGSIREKTTGKVPTSTGD
jgi:hypothetical protein